MSATADLLARRAKVLADWGVEVTPDIFEELGAAIDKAHRVLDEEVAA